MVKRETDLHLFMHTRKVYLVSSCYVYDDGNEPYDSANSKGKVGQSPFWQTVHACSMTDFDYNVTNVCEGNKLI